MFSIINNFPFLFASIALLSVIVYCGMYWSALPCGLLARCIDNRYLLINNTGTILYVYKDKDSLIEILCYVTIVLGLYSIRIYFSIMEYRNWTFFVFSSIERTKESCLIRSWMIRQSCNA